jgi:hypothetical protein
MKELEFLHKRNLMAFGEKEWMGFYIPMENIFYIWMQDIFYLIN